MKNKSFIIPVDSVIEFTEQLINSELDNQITEFDAENETITIDVAYDTANRETMYDLIEWVEDNIEDSE